MARQEGSPPIFIISGGEGASGKQLVHTAIAQFQEVDVPTIILPHVHRETQIKKAVDRAARTGGTIVHTLVDAEMRRALIQQARASNVVAIDLMGRLLSRLSSTLEQRPVGRPGLYRQLRQEYFDRVEAVEFTVAHDDSRNLHELHRAEIVLVGVSRVGKTPLSMYLALLGWKVANVPVVPQVPPPDQLFKVDPRRVVGLTIAPDQLMIHRRIRLQRLKVHEQTPYTRAPELDQEVEVVRRLCRHHRFALVEVTDKPIEESAEEVISRVTRRLEEPEN